MAKILISFLGTGRLNTIGTSKREYEKAKYNIEGKIYEGSFITKALDEHYGIDKVFYIGTLKSMWEEVYRIYDPSEVNEDTYYKLVEEIEKWDHKSSIEDHKNFILDSFSKQSKLLPIIIKYGLNQEEINFNIVQILEIEKHINNGDSIYLDITHGFRSLPLLLMNVFNYLSDVSNKKFTIKGISYGMFEAKDQYGITPVVNLDLITELHQNIKAAHEFNKYGNAFLFSELLKDNCKSMSKVLLDFSLSKSLNHIYDLKQKISQFNSFKNEYKNLTSIQKITIPKTIDNFVNRFSKAKKDSHYQYEIAKWMYDNKQYGYAAISLIEGLITKVCEDALLNAGDQLHRDFAKTMIVFSTKNEKSVINEIKKQKLQDKSRIEKEILLKNCSKYTEIQHLWGDTNKIRKSVSHAISTELSVSKMIKDLEKNIQLSEKIIYNLNFNTLQ